MSETKSLRARAMDIVSRREVSRMQLQRKLAPYAQCADQLAAVLDEFTHKNWQSDRRFTEAYIHSKSTQYGSLRLKQALIAQGIDDQTAKEFLPDEAQEHMHATAVLRKKFKQPAANFTEKQKQIRFLLYRGFSMDTINAVIGCAWNDEFSGSIND